MLKFIFGLPRSGKTTEILKIVKNLTELNKKSVIIVPEQASFETEKAVLHTVGDAFALNVEVISFSRLQEEVSRKIGGISAKILKDSDKIIFMNRALCQIAPELKLWGKYANSLTFARTMLDTIGEFKISAVSVSEIKTAQLLAQSIALRNKLHDLALIYETYETLIAERYIDPVDNLTKLYLNLENYPYFANKTVFIDGFKGFTGQQFKIISRIFSQANDVYFAFTNDILTNKQFDVFANIRTAVSRIEKLAKAHNVAICEPMVLNKSYYNSESLRQVERLLSDNEFKKVNNGEVTICRADTIFEEAEFVARTIRRLVRTEKYRFRDFVIIARDTEKYAIAVEYACQKNKIDCFLDKKLSLSDFVLSVAALAAIRALDFSTENILRFHKSGINVLSCEEISALENYTYLWNINGEIWLEDWEMDVRGFVNQESTEDFVFALENINSIRKKAIEPLLEFKQNFKGSARSMAKAIFDLFEKCSAADTLKKMCSDFSNSDIYSEDILKQSYDLFMNILDSLVICFGERTLKTTEFYDALNLALSLEEVGIIPQTVDQVIFGQADRIRPSNPKVAFILGANQGVFPKYSENNGLFAVKERKMLIDLGIDITDNLIYTSVDENYLVYCNLCCPSDKLYICYSAQTLKGEDLTEASFVSSLKENLSSESILEPPQNLSSETVPETVDSAFSQLCRSFRNIKAFTTLKAAIDRNSDVSKTDNLVLAVTSKNRSITKENARKLYGKDIYMSASKFDAFNRCAFSYFCKYGLRLNKLQPADFDVLQRGTIVHYVLERIISEFKESIKNFTREKLDSLCDFYINEYLDAVVGFRSVQTAKHDFLISKISRSLKEVVWHLSQEFAQSDFKPTHCELKIGGNSGIPLKFDYTDGEIIINGSIDRVDEYNGYIRIVDYKTGTKSFKLPDILFGLNLQMLIYLYAIVRGQNLNDSCAAGIFYMPSKRDLNNEGMAMNGLIKADTELIHAMEKENRGEFVPSLSVNKDGSISKTSTSFITEVEFSKIFDYIEKLMKKTGDSISSGDIDINPVDGRESCACDYCDFKSVCGLEDDIATKVPNLKNDQVFCLMEKEEDDGF